MPTEDQIETMAKVIASALAVEADAIERIAKAALISAQNIAVERCAQVARDLLSGDDYPSDPELGEKVAAAIRKLKDKP